MLLIDIGNSRIKWALWQDDQPLDISAALYQEDDLAALLTEKLSGLTEQNVYLCSVVNSQINQVIIEWFALHWHIEVVMVKSRKKQLGVVNAYSDEETLGVDRWLGMLAAYHRHGTAVCVISCGTAVTFDVVDHNGQHLGGLIMPGVNIMRQSLLDGTKNIKSGQGVKVSGLADNTESAVISGCVQLLSSGLDGLFKKYIKQASGDILCVLTGGDGEMLGKLMESDCCYEEDLILYGLYLVSQEKN